MASSLSGTRARVIRPLQAKVIRRVPVGMIDPIAGCPSHRDMSAKLRSFIDALVAHLTESAVG